MNEAEELGELERRSGIPPHPEKTATAVAIASGAVTGALIGVLALAGPIVVVIGGLLGGVAGAAVERVVRARSERQRARDEVLDREIGVSGGDIGATPAT